MATEQHQPTIESSDGFTVVGIPFDATEESDFGAFWDEFGRRMAEFPGALEDQPTYGVSYAFTEESQIFTYLAGIRVEGDVPLPEGWTEVDLVVGTYAVFETTLADVGDLMTHIYRDWLPASAYERLDAPEFERYAADFDPDAPTATFSIYIPVVEA